MSKTENEKLIDQCQQIADDGCFEFKDCETECLLRKREICQSCKLIDYDDSRYIAYAFLAGIAFEKGLI